MGWKRGHGRYNPEKEDKKKKTHKNATKEIVFKLWFCAATLCFPSILCNRETVSHVDLSYFIKM